LERKKNGWAWCTKGVNCYENGTVTKFTTVDPDAADRVEKQKFQKEQQEKVKDMPTIGSITLSSGGGFTIDPRTGQKKPANKGPKKGDS